MSSRQASWCGMIHGGVIALMLDEAVGWAGWHSGIPARPIAWRCATGCPAPGRARRVVGRVDRVRQTLVYASASIDKLSDRARIAEATATLMAVPTKLTAPR